MTDTNDADTKKQRDAAFDAEFGPKVQEMMCEMNREFAKPAAVQQPIVCDLGASAALSIDELLAMIPGTVFHQFVAQCQANPLNIVQVTRRGALRITRAHIEDRLNSEALKEAAQQFEHIKSLIETEEKVVHLAVVGLGVWPTMDEIRSCVRYLPELIRLCLLQQPEWLCEPYSHGLTIGKLDMANKDLYQRYRSHRGSQFLFNLQQHSKSHSDSKESLDLSNCLDSAVLSTPTITHASVLTLSPPRLKLLREIQQRLDAGEKEFVCLSSNSSSNFDTETLLNEEPLGDMWRVLRADPDNHVHITTNGFMLTSKKLADSMLAQEKNDQVARARASLFS
jgi:hypothetical protein